VIDGILNIYKEPGYTSHDIVARLRGIVRQKKIGHTGTLDPEARGVLPVCLGRATKVCDLLTDHDKTYQAVLLLGTVTDTQDTTGEILSRQEVTVTKAQVTECILGFVGKQQQIPPMYSALKVGGKKLYELARQGIEVERKPREIEITSIMVDQIDLPRVTLTVSCSKGTYIRTLCHDIGAALGCGGCMESLLRTRVGSFDAADAITLACVEELVRADALGDVLIPTDRVFEGLEAVHLTAEGSRLVHNGNPFHPALCAEGTPDAADGQFRVYDSDGTFLAIYRWEIRRCQYVPVKMFL
jgi:tRNA pseudouridine55 synthase